MDVEKLRELERRATAAPWEWVGSDLDGPDCTTVITVKDTPEGAWSELQSGELVMENEEHDRALIVALRNAAPEILEKLARLEKLERVAEAARVVDGFADPESSFDRALSAALADLDGGKPS